MECPLLAHSGHAELHRALGVNADMICCSANVR
jgi:hypothetical protein